MKLQWTCAMSEIRKVPSINFPDNICIILTIGNVCTLAYARPTNFIMPKTFIENHVSFLLFFCFSSILKFFCFFSVLHVAFSFVYYSKCTCTLHTMHISFAKRKTIHGKINWALLYLWGLLGGSIVRSFSYRLIVQTACTYNSHISKPVHIEYTMENRVRAFIYHGAIKFSRFVNCEKTLAKQISRFTC